MYIYIYVCVHVENMLVGCQQAKLMSYSVIEFSIELMAINIHCWPQQMGHTHEQKEEDVTVLSSHNLLIIKLSADMLCRYVHAM